MSKVYLIKCEKTGEVIRWEGSLIDFLNTKIYWMSHSDGERRILAYTRKKQTFYKGWKILFYGEEEPKMIALESKWEEIDLREEDPNEEEFKQEFQMKYEPQDKYESTVTNKEIENRWEETNRYMKVEFPPKPIMGDLKYNRGEEHIFKTKEGKELYNKTKPKRNVLFIPDLHCPFDYVKGIEMAKKIYEENECTEVVFLGDVVDFYSISEYGKSPDFMSQSEEMIKTKRHLKAWHDAFPIAKICTGNHTMRIKKKFDKSGLSLAWMKSFGEMFELKDWSFQLYHEIGNFIATHGMGQNAKARSKDLHKSVICGHLHAKFESNYADGLWAIYGGCMIDIDARAFEYGKFFSLPKLGFVIIKDIENIPVIKMIPVKYAKDNDYNKMHEMW